MTAQQTAQTVITAVLLITVVIAGIFAVELAGIWLRNRREERANGVREAEQRMSARHDTERNSWIALIAEKDREIAGLTETVSKLTKNYDITNRILRNAEIRKENA